ncbi:MAG: hypothetical protein FJX03_05285 [Alphaproteobacteria bacterium]|nr:hypothetical protein [Alphaproteobacteria bacterium]
MGLHATILFAGIFGLMYLYLTVEVTKLRAKYQVWVGHGGHLDLLKAIRIHGNFAEYIPFIMLLLFLSELIGGRSWMLYFLGSLLLGGRILHIIGLRKTEGPSLHRFVGGLLTWTVLLVLSVFCFASAF